MQYGKSLLEQIQTMGVAMKNILNIVRPFTPEEEEFIREAEANSFSVVCRSDGSPIAMGARRAGRLFSMSTKETKDFHFGGSVYSLDKDY